VFSFFFPLVGGLLLRKGLLAVRSCCRGRVLLADRRGMGYFWKLLWCASSGRVVCLFLDFCLEFPTFGAPALVAKFPWVDDGIFSELN
jgi:hypothetical protein